MSVQQSDKGKGVPMKRDHEGFREGENGVQYPPDNSENIPLKVPRRKFGHEDWADEDWVEQAEQLGRKVTKDDIKEKAKMLKKRMPSSTFDDLSGLGKDELKRAFKEMTIHYYAFKYQEGGYTLDGEKAKEKNSAFRRLIGAEKERLDEIDFLAELLFEPTINNAGISTQLNKLLEDSESTDSDESTISTKGIPVSEFKDMNLGS